MTTGPADTASLLRRCDLVDKRLNVRLVVKVIGRYGGMAHEVGGARHVAALRWCWVKGRVLGLKVRSDAGEVLEWLKGVFGARDGRYRQEQGYTRGAKSRVHYDDIDALWTEDQQQPPDGWITKQQRERERERETGKQTSLKGKGTEMDHMYKKRHRKKNKASHFYAMADCWCTANSALVRNGILTRR